MVLFFFCETLLGTMADLNVPIIVILILEARFLGLAKIPSLTQQPEMIFF